MSQALTFILSLSFCFLQFTPFFASAAVLLPPISLSNDNPLALSPTTNLTTNLTTNPHGQIRCILPFRHPIDPVNFRTCQPTIDRLLSYPWANTPCTYRLIKGAERNIKITSGICAISLDRWAQEGEITISLSQIVQSVTRILWFCGAYGEGGWQFVDPPWKDWIVIVQGTGDVAGGRNGTVGELGESVVGVGEEK